MKLNTKTRTVEEFGQLSAPNNFKIAATGKAFRLLSDGLYSDKPLAIIRELSCNAWDSHIAAKNTKTKVEVKLPSWMDRTFSVRDFGVGLSHEEINEIYTTYFESTKSNSNDFVGAFGLGSKSPFSYTDSFTVEATKDGVKRTYDMFINEHEVPQVRLLVETPTTDPNGLMVSFDVKATDVDNFKKAAERFFRFAEGNFSITGTKLDIKKTEVRLEDPRGRWQILDSERDRFSNTGSTRIVVQGGVAYPLDGKLVNIPNTLSYLDFIIKFDMGELDVAMNREALSYDKPTIANINKRLLEVEKEVTEAVSKEIQGEPSYYEAAVRWGSYPRGLRQLQPTYNGATLKESLDTSSYQLDDLLLQYDSVKNFDYENQTTPRWIKFRGSWSLNISNRLVIIFIEKGKYRNLMNLIAYNVQTPTTKLGKLVEQERSTNAKSKSALSGRAVNIVVLKDAMAGPKFKDFKNLITGWGIPSIDFSDLEIPQKIAHLTARNYVVKARQFNAKGELKQVSVSFKAGGKYIPTYKGAIKKPTGGLLSATELKNWAQKLNAHLTFDWTDVVFVPKTLQARLDTNSSKWTNVTQEVFDSIRKICDTERNARILYHAARSKPREYDAWVGLNHTISQSLPKLKKYCVLRDKYPTAEYSNASNILTIKEEEIEEKEGAALAKKFKQEIDAICNEVPLLKMIQVGLNYEAEQILIKELKKEYA